MRRSRPWPTRCAGRAAGCKNPKRPIGSFIFLGSSGVGKTELAKALAEFLFDDEEALIRIDMSEYQERHTVSRMFGAPPGYVGYDEGGQLTEAVRRRPYRVILFDEIEKAHPEVWNSLLQILEDGRLTDGQGHVVDFRNTVIIMTSNIGTQFVGKGGPLGFLRSDELSEQERQLREDIESELKQTFRPEFLNRIDEIIIFHGLTQEHVMQIVDLQMREVAERLAEHGVKIELTDAARRLAGEGRLRPAVRRPARPPHAGAPRGESARQAAAGRRVPGRRHDRGGCAENEDGKTEPVFTARPPEPIAVELPMGEISKSASGK